VILLPNQQPFPEVQEAHAGEIVTLALPMNPQGRPYEGKKFSKINIVFILQKTKLFEVLRSKKIKKINHIVFIKNISLMIK
jgi:hypothetical protein